MRVFMKKTPAIGVPCRQRIHLRTENVTVFTRPHKLDDQKHVFYKFMHQTDRRTQVLRLLVYLPRQRMSFILLSLSIDI